MRYELTDHEWAAIKPMLPNKARGVARVNDRRVLNGVVSGVAVRGALGGTCRRASVHIPPATLDLRQTNSRRRT